jgi:hypothetical protein
MGGTRNYAPTADRISGIDRAGASDNFEVKPVRDNLKDTAFTPRNNFLLRRLELVVDGQLTFYNRETFRANP